MLDTCANYIVSALYTHCRLSDSRKSIYLYGCKLALSTGMSICSILLISAFLGKLSFGVVFVLIFVSLRLFVGGFHANTYRNCFLITNSTFGAAYGLACFLIWERSLLPCFLLNVVAGCIIIIFAPIKNHNHPLSGKAYQKNRKIGLCLLAVELSLSFILLGITKSMPLFSISTASFAAVAAMMIPPILAERRKLS